MASESRRRIAVSGEAKVDLPLDTAYVAIEIKAKGTSLLGAQRDAARGLADVVERVRGLGVADTDSQPLLGGSWQQEDDGASFVVETYVVTNQLRLRIRDVTTVGELLDAAADAGATGIRGIAFATADRRANESRAREAALRDAEARASEIARLGGLQLGPVLSVSEAVATAGALASGVMPYEPFDPYEGTGDPGWPSVTVKMRVVYAVE